MRSLLVAVGFLTRVPVPPAAFADTRAQSRSLAWYPLVGGLLGLALAALAWSLESAPPLLSAALLLVAWTWATGALHLDGLADSADAWVGGHGATPALTRERTLEIMKDPRCGPMGVVALVGVLLLKFAALASLPPGAVLLPLAPLLGRAVLTLAFLTTPYVRREGLGSALVSAPRGWCMAALLVVVFVCAALRLPGALAVGAALLVFLLWRRACIARLGGMTGDTAGALAEATETAVLVAIALAR